MLKVFCILITLGLIGCMAAVFGTADQLNQLSIGMPKGEVLKRLGSPKTVSATDGIEYLHYSWVKTVIAADGNFPEDYYVAIKNGQVASYGRNGDFDSAKLPAHRIEIDQTIRKEGENKEKIDLYTELQKLNNLKTSGIISQEEFNIQKRKLLSKE